MWVCSHSATLLWTGVSNHAGYKCTAVSVLCVCCVMHVYVQHFGPELGFMSAALWRARGVQSRMHTCTDRVQID